MKYKKRSVTFPDRPLAPAYLGICDSRTRVPDMPACVFLINLRDAQGASEKTQHNYADTILHFLNAVAASPSLNGDWRLLEDKHLAAYHKERAFELKQSSLDVMCSRLKVFFDWCYESGWMSKRFNYSWTLPHQFERKVKESRGAAKSQDPFDLFGQYIPEADFEYALGFLPRKKSYERIRDEIIMRLAYYSGMRAAETVDPHNIALFHIKECIKQSREKGLEGMEWPIIGKGSRGGKTRTVYVPPAVVRRIESFMRNELARQAPDATLLIGKKSDSRTLALSSQHATNLFTQMRKSLLENGELEASRNWRIANKRSFHSLRHSYATNFADEILAKKQPLELLVERMGHADVSTTKIYLWFSAKRAGDAQAAQKYYRFVNGYKTTRANFDEE